MKKEVIIGAALGNCVHVAGVMHFLQLAENEGYQTCFLGPAVSVEKLFKSIELMKPDIVAVSYRLTPASVRPLIESIIEKNEGLAQKPRWEFGGTKPVADVAAEYHFFEYISNGYDDIGDSIRYLRGGIGLNDRCSYGADLLERIGNSYPYPILRHHFGLPDLEETIKGVRQIAEAKVLDVISLGPDQNAQQYFFNPQRMKPEFNGAGGVPVRCADDFRRLKEASEYGNFPLMRCYSGTEDVFQYAELLLDTIRNAWTAVPLCWYNELDGRGTRPLERSIAEAHELIRWHAVRGIPVEINEPHHWGLRDAHDVIPVVMAYISAYTAKKLGVKHYVAQYMFNNPSTTSFPMDFAKVLAMIEMVESLADDDFTIFRETRTGLALLHADEDIAKGQLAASTFMQMAVKPHIVHVVGYCEADHAARAEDVIASCKIVRGVIRHTLNESFAMAQDAAIEARKNELIREARELIGFIKKEYDQYEDPIFEPEVLVDCIEKGYIDAVHIMKGEKFRGNLSTKIVDGKCVAYDKNTGHLLSESERLFRLKQMHMSGERKII